MTFTPLAPAPTNRAPGDTSVTGDNNANAAAIGALNDRLAELVNGESAEFATQHPSLQAAADAAAAAGRPLYIPRGVWNLTAPVELPDDMLVLGDGEQTIIDVSAFGTNQGAFHITGAKHESRALSADAVEGSRTVTLGTDADATYLAGFDWVKIHSERSTGESGVKQGEWVQVESQSTNTLTLRDPLTDTYRTVDTATITAFAMRRNVTIRDLAIRGGTDPLVMHGGVKTRFAHNVRVTGCRFHRTHYTGIMMWDVVDWRVTDCHFSEILASGTGYGVAAGWASQDGVMSACTGRRMRHLFTTVGSNEVGTYGRPSRITVTGCKAYQVTAAGFDTHPAAVDITFDGNTVLGSVGVGIQMRAVSGEVVNNTVRGVRDTSATYGIYVVAQDEAPGQIVVANNHITGRSQEGNFTGVLVRSWTGYPGWDGVVVEGNRISVCHVGVYIRNVAGDEMAPFTVAGNTVAKCLTYGVLNDNADGVTVTGNSIHMTGGNAGIRGVYVLNCEGVTVTGNYLKGIAGTRGVQVNGSANTTITGNRIRDFGIGVDITSTSDGTVVMGNSLRNNTTPLQNNGTTTLATTTDHGGAYNAV